MGRRSRTRYDGGADPQGGVFPLVVAGLSTFAALLLFFSGTIPALREDRHLREFETDRARIHQDLWHELDAEAARRLALRIDIQNLLVELDRRGIDTWPILYGPPPEPASEPKHPEGR